MRGFATLLNRSIPYLSKAKGSFINKEQGKRNLSLFNKAFITSPLSQQIEHDLDRAIKLVQRFDPVGYLPGLLVTNEARLGYFAGIVYFLFHHD
jgi:hypothetical protein